ncbi:MAG: helix-turn-helix domain-containing protein [Candidatus Methanoperedens sp.]
MIISAKVRQQTREDIYARKFRNLPLSAKFVFKILEYNGLFTQKEIAQESGLPGRTVRYALKILGEEGIIEKRIYKDARQTLYGLKSSHVNEEAVNFSCIPL